MHDLKGVGGGGEISSFQKVSAFVAKIVTIHKWQLLSPPDIEIILLDNDVFACAVSRQLNFKEPKRGIAVKLANVVIDCDEEKIKRAGTHESKTIESFDMC